MASSSSDPGLKHEVGGGSGGGETSEAVIANDQLLLYRGLKKAKKERGCTAKERISKMPPCTAGKRSSIYRGVTRFIVKTDSIFATLCAWNARMLSITTVYLGAYDDEEAAARAYDLAALKYWGPGTLINFPVTDYARDLEEMQNVSREEYLASLRRKSSGFSRGISKYRGLSSSRWDSSLARMAGSEYFNNVHYGEDPSTENEYLGGFCLERKIDLTNYIKWWGPNKSRQAESAAKSSEEAKQGYTEDISGELKKSEWAIQCTEPYEMPRLGVSLQGKKNKGSAVSALSILSQSAAYKSFQEKALKKQEKNTDNDENENKNIINKMDYGKAVEKSTSHDGGGSERLGAALGLSGGLSLQKNMFPLTPFLSAPLLTNYNTMDQLVDPILWTSLVPALPTGLARNSEVDQKPKNKTDAELTLLHRHVTKTESSSTYTFFRPEE
ncbi:hypothetical protein EZV62_005284 [Acer yangbiense]|uniref:AP2/ERF domain-containing protein n=1 Tax=Acer yangbiense TaxID=1000413 RepID=A0A5C7IMQ1_9ROSI|nr:hypothetical protein EZV62_005284 [Acer yangbiense]